MSSKKAAFTQTPFENLSQLLKSNNIELAPDPQKTVVAPKVTVSSGNPPRDVLSDRKLFLEAMADVVPIKKEIHPPRRCSTVIKRGFKDKSKNIQLKKLNNLIQYGEGFIISQTSEYMEGVNAKTHPELTKLLHDGRFTIQDHIDLHGLTVKSAKTAFDQFIKNAVSTHKKGILIVHGRGLSSPVEPVLKNCVYRWLSSGPWRKWVVAFTSARACDGGAGATYVLLRDNPAKKQSLKKMNKGKF